MIGPAPDLSSGPAELWRLTSAGIEETNSLSEPAVLDGVFYSENGSGNMLALDAKTGSEIWRCAIGSRLTSPTVLDGKVIFGAGDSNIHAISASTGDMVWETPIDGVPGNVLAVNGILFFPGIIDHAQSNVYALNVEDGSMLWQYPIVNPESSINTFAMAASPSRLFVKGAKNAIHSLDLQNGTEIWRVVLDESNVINSITVSNGLVTVSGYGALVQSFDESNGNELWRYQLGSGSASNPVVSDGVIYIADADTTIRAIDQQTGAERWRYQTEDSYATSAVGYIGVTALSIVDGVLFAGWRFGWAMAFSATDGTLLWSYSEFTDGFGNSVKAIPNAPIVADGMIYVNVLIAFPDKSSAFILALGNPT